MRDLFTPITRDERQDECKRAWLKHKGKGTIEACTGFGCIKILTGYLKTCIKNILLINTQPFQLRNHWNN